MAVRPEFRWWFLTLAVVGVLLLISALALDRPDVVWHAGAPHCPHCRSDVELYSLRCRTCREQYDWSVAPDEQSPLCRWCLSALESDFLQARKAALGRDVAAERVTAALGLSKDAAILYLDHAGRGLCGWCGGTGLDLAQGDRAGKPCPACLGRAQCVGCGGDRRVRVGDEAAHLAFLAYDAGVRDVAEDLPVDVQRAEIRRLAEQSLPRSAGTEEAAGIAFWPSWEPTGAAATVVEAARSRIDLVREALAGD